MAIVVTYTISDNDLTCSCGDAFWSRAALNAHVRTRQPLGYPCQANRRLHQALQLTSHEAEQESARWFRDPAVRDHVLEGRAHPSIELLV